MEVEGRGKGSSVGDKGMEGGGALLVNTLVHRGREGRNGMRKDGGRDLRRERKCLEGEGIFPW